MADTIGAGSSMIQCYLPVGWGDFWSGVLHGIGFFTVLGVLVALWYWNVVD